MWVLGMLIFQVRWAWIPSQLGVEGPKGSCENGVGGGDEKEKKTLLPIVPLRENSDLENPVIWCELETSETSEENLDMTELKASWLKGAVRQGTAIPENFSTSAGEEEEALLSRDEVLSSSGRPIPRWKASSEMGGGGQGEVRKVPGGTL